MGSTVVSYFFTAMITCLANIVVHVNQSVDRSVGRSMQVTQLLHYWMRLSNDGQGGEEKAAAQFLQVLHQRNALKTDEV